MAGWEEELANILHTLGVEQEQPAPHRRPLRKPTRHHPGWDEQIAEAIHWDALQGNDDDSEKNEDEAEAWLLEELEGLDDIEEIEREADNLWMQDLELMRYEVDSIVSQVIRLMQSGDLDASLKEDVMIVLRALRRRSGGTQQAAKSDETYLESASALLHFCRLVLQLSDVSNEG